MFLSNLSSWFV